MGFKTLKEHYRIGHMVCVTNQGICIGSPYIPDLIVIGFDGEIIKADNGRVNDDLKRYMSEMRADPDKLREVVQAKDTFAVEIPVYTYAGGNIIEKQCEKVGWPNVTNDGHLMYENTYSTDKNYIVHQAKANARYAVEWEQEQIEELKSKLALTKKLLKKYRANVNKLQRDFPDAT